MYDSRQSGDVSAEKPMTTITTTKTRCTRPLYGAQIVLFVRMCGCVGVCACSLLPRSQFKGARVQRTRRCRVLITNQPKWRTTDAGDTLTYVHKQINLST